VIVTGSTVCDSYRFYCVCDSYRFYCVW